MLQPYQEQEFVLQPGDLIALFSDGVTEAQDIDENEFGEERTASFIRPIAHETAEAIVELVFLPGVVEPPGLGRRQFRPRGVVESVTHVQQFVGVGVAIAWFARSQKIPFLHLADLIASTAAAGLLFGRVANFINGELWGKITDMPWAVIFPHSAGPATPLHLILPRHPSQLYAAALEGALLLAIMQWRFWRSDITRTKPGHLAGEFWLVYAVVRIIGENFREPDAGLIMGLNRGAFYSFFLVAGGLVFIGLSRRKAAP
jgi:hypothetical protein